MMVIAMSLIIYVFKKMMMVMAMPMLSGLMMIITIIYRYEGEDVKNVNNGEEDDAIPIIQKEEIHSYKKIIPFIQK